MGDNGIDMPEGPLGGPRPFSSVEPFQDTLTGEVYEIFDSIPEWAKSASSCVDFITNNFEEDLIRMGDITREEGVEVAISLCYNGSTYSTDLERGGGKTAPGASCDKAIRLADIHTHPVGKSAFPSITDVRSSVQAVTGLPNEFNEVIYRPERNPVPEHGQGTCANFHNMESRCLADKISKLFKGGKQKEAERLIRDKLIGEQGDVFTIEVNDA